MLSLKATCCCVCPAAWPWRFRSTSSTTPRIQNQHRSQHLGTSSRGTQREQQNESTEGVWLFEEFHCHSQRKDEEAQLSRSTVKVKRQSKFNTIRLSWRRHENRLKNLGSAMLRPEFLAALRHQASQIRVVQNTSSLRSNCWI